MKFKVGDIVIFKPKTTAKLLGKVVGAVPKDRHYFIKWPWGTIGGSHHEDSLELAFEPNDVLKEML